MHAVRSGEAIGAVYIPRGLERDIAAGKRPQIVIFYNKQYFTPGNIAVERARRRGVGRDRRSAALRARRFALSRPARWSSSSTC